MALSVLAQMLKARWKTPEAAMKVLFPEANETERNEIMRNLNYDEITHRNRSVTRGDRRYAQDDGPDNPPLPSLRFGEQPGYGPNSSTNQGQEMDEDLDEELGEKIDGICQALGVDPARDKEVYDGIVRRVRSVRARDQGTPDPMRRVPRVNSEYDRYSKDRRRHGAHDAYPRGRDDFLERFPEVRRITILD